MKTQKELTQLFTKQVAEIRLSQEEVNLAADPNAYHDEVVKILTNIASGIKELRNLAVKSNNKYLEALAKKLDKALAK